MDPMTEANAGLKQVQAAATDTAKAELAMGQSAAREHPLWVFLAGAAVVVLVGILIALVF